MAPKNEPLIQLPSPNQLKYKYLLRGKIGSVINKRFTNDKCDEDNEVVESMIPIDPEFSKLILLLQVKLSNNLHDDIEKRKFSKFLIDFHTVFSCI